MMGSQAPPHPGSFWQECQDVNTGYAYYWNTINNQVVWECPVELIQYRQSLLAAVPPPLPPPPTATATSNGAGSGKGLIGLGLGGYGSDTDDDNEDKVEEENGEAKGDEEKDPEFIGPKIPMLPQEETHDIEMAENGKNVDVDPSNPDTNPPDIQDENSEPPIPGMEDSSMPEEPVMSITEQILSSLPPPPPPLVPAGLASLVSAYSDSDNSEDDDEKPKPKSHFKEVKGQMDSSGRLRFGAHTSWQTEEQKAALASYMVEEKASVLKAEVKKTAKSSAKSSAKETVVSHGRKQRIALPGGKFNKSDSQDKKPSVEPKSDFALKFVKSDSVLPGSEPPKQDEGAASDAQEDLDARVQRLMSAQASLKAPTPEPAGEDEHRPSPPPTPPAQEKISERELSRERSKSVEEKEEIGRSDLSEDELAEELVEKLQHFKVNTEKISALKLLAVKIETLYSAWCAGALNRKYLKIFLENAHRKMILVEKFDLCTGPWTARWDRNEKRYEFTNSETGVTTHINPNSGGLVGGFDEPESPQPPASPQAKEVQPPPPPPSDSPPAPPPAFSPPPPAPQSPTPPPPPPPEEESEEGEVDEELDELINPTLVAPPVRSSVSPSATVNNEPEDMDMSEDELNENDDDGIPLTPPTPGDLSSDNESDDDREGLSATTPPPGMESTPKPRPHRAAASEDMMHAVQRGDLPPPPPGVVMAAAPGHTVSAKPQVKVPAQVDKRSLNLTDELSSFYSEIGFSDPVDEPVPGVQEESLPEAATSHTVSSAEPTPPREIGSGGDSGPPSPTGSPVPKKRKKKDKNVKVSSSLSMKKKGLNSMLTKWQNIK